MENNEKNLPQPDQQQPKPTDDVQLEIETVTPETEDMKPLDDADRSEKPEHQPDEEDAGTSR